MNNKTNDIESSLQLDLLEKQKRKQKVFKKKKTINYTTIRKQIPSFEHSVESASSGVKILKYPKPTQQSTISSNSGSILMLNNLKQNLTTSNHKSQNYNIFKTNKIAKVIKVSSKTKILKTKKPKVSKCAIDLFKTNPVKSPRMDSDDQSKDYHSVKEELKTISSNHSKSSERRITTSSKGDQFPMPPGKALKLFMLNKLTNYEHSEILDFDQVYFIGATDKKINATKDKTDNFGYDDDRGDYRIIQNDHIAFRYEILSTLGQGSFGQVIKVLDHKTKEQVALKIIRNKKKFVYQANVEINVLKDIKNNDLHDKSNIIKLIDNFMFRNHIWLTFNLYSINLFELIKENHYQGFPLDIIRRFAIQILQSLRFLRKRNIIHCDLKPENILLKRKNKTGIKVIDLGSSWYQHEQVYTYIQSRFYRAPEIMLGIPYTPAIDMWSFAWILVELFIGYPLFPGESEEEQFNLIMEYKGIPPINMLENATRLELFFDENLKPIPVKDSMEEVLIPNTKALSQLLNWNDKSFIKFIDSCLHWDPDLRLTPSEALHHEWISSVFGKL